jgi:hypothetical protein
MSPIVFNNTNTVFDNTNIYFVDVVPNPNLPGAYIYNFFEAPLAGGPATQIGTASPPLDALYSMVDTDGTNLILEFEYLATSPMTFGLYSLSVTGSATQSPTPLLEYNVPGAASLNAFLDYGSDHLFVNEVQSGTMSTTTSLVFAPSSATPLLGPTPTTSFVQWLPVIAGSPTNDTVLQFQNLPSDGTDGDALLNDMTADTLIPTTLSLNGSPYIVPAQNTVTLTPVSNTIAQGAQFGIGTTSSAGGCNSSGSGSSSGGAAFWLPYLESESNSGSSPNAVSSVGLAVNVSNNQIITIAPPADTNLSPF